MIVILLVLLGLMLGSGVVLVTACMASSQMSHAQESAQKDYHAKSM